MNDPTQVAGPLERELAARRALQAARARRAEDGEIDRLIDEENACPECGPDNPLVVELGEHRGFVPTGRGEGDNAPAYRPCFTCNEGHWRDWQAGRRCSSGRAKVESPADRQVRAQDRQKRERSSFA